MRLSIITALLAFGLTASGGGLLASHPTATGNAWYSSLAITAPATATAGSTGLKASVSYVANTTYTWAIQGGTIQGSATGRTITFSAGQPGTLTLSCTASHQGATSTGRVAVLVKGQAPAPVTITAAASAQTGTSGLSASVPAQAGCTYSWVVSGPATVAAGATAPTLLYNAVAPGLVTLSCTVSNAYGSTSAQATEQILGIPPSAPAITAPASVSALAKGLSASVPATSGCTYAWTITGGTLVAANTPAVTFNAGSAGVLTLACTVSNAYGSASAQDQVQVLANAPLTPVITAPSQTHAQSLANSASVPAQANCTYAWSVTGGTLVSGQGTQAITFNAGAAGTLKLACTVTNSALVSASGTASVAVLPYQTAGHYGSGLNVDALANTPVGRSSSYQVSYRIRANHTGPLQAIRPFFIWSYTTPGYALGTGGTIQVQLQTDDGSANHVPSGTTLASLTYAKPVNDTIGFYPLLAFASMPTLQSGSLYHLVFTNIDADPVNNWVCLDSAYMDYAGSPMQPTVADLDLATLWRTGSTGTWSLRKTGPTESFTPIVELDYADGASQGQGYMEFWIGDAKNISGTKGVRETFTVTGSDRLVSTMAVRVKPVSGTSPLTLRLEQGDGTLIDQETVSGITLIPGLSGASWAKATLATPRTLKAGQTYHLVLSAPADTVYTAYPMRKGSDKGFKSTTLFTDGYAQFNPGTGWTGWDQWGQPNRLDSDLQFYFDVVQ